MNEELRFDILYFEDCPSWKMAVGMLEEVIGQIGLQARTESVRVETAEAAQESRFVGSPSILLNGEDLFPVDHEDYALGCRVYQTPEGFRGWPTAEMLEAAITKRLSRYYAPGH